MCTPRLGLLRCLGLLGWGAVWVAAASAATGAIEAEALKSDLWQSRDTEWVRWVVVNVVPARVYRATWRNDARRGKLLTDFDPDVVDWWSGRVVSRGGFLRRRGVACSAASEYEYQEAIGPMWGFARALFADNGMAIRETGHWARFPRTKYGGAHMMCLNAPKWRHVVEQGLARVAMAGDSVTQDNIGCPVEKYHPGFCRWCEREFKEFLRERFPAQRLRAMGIADLESFRLRPYLTQQRDATGLALYKPVPAGSDPEALLRDPVIHEYVRFQYRSMFHRWVQFAEQSKRSARHFGRPVPATYGNQAGVAGQTPLAVALCPHVDVVWVESSRQMQPCFPAGPGKPSKKVYREGVFVDAEERKEAGGYQPGSGAWSTLMYKVGRAAGHFQRPVWTIQYPGQWWGEERRLASTVAFAEAYANGGVPVLLFTPSVTQTGDTDGVMWRTHRRIARFVGRRRWLFVDRGSVADVAIVQSLACTFWRRCTSLRAPVAHLDCFAAAARRLEEWHVPYDALVLGHPDLYDDGPSLGRLRQYRCVVLPHVDCLSDRQVAALSRYVEQGGRLVLIGDVGVNDEELRARPRSGADRLAALAGGRVTRLADLPALVQDQLTGPKPLVQTDLPRSVWLNVWRHGGGPMTSVQMVNYDLDVAADKAHPVGPFTLRLRRVPGVEFHEALWLGFDDAEVRLPLSEARDHWEVRAPGLDVWGCVVFAGPGERALRAGAAEARKWRERLGIAASQGPASAALMAEADGLLPSVQAAAAPADGGALRAEFEDVAGRLRKRVSVLAEQAAAADQATRSQALGIDAVRRFDFGHAGAAPGWLEVKCDTLYSAESGYGWLGAGQRTAVDDAGPDGMHRDYIRNRDPAEYLTYAAKHVGNRQFKSADPPATPGRFRMDLPNGEYTLTVIVGTHECAGAGSAADEGRVGVTCVDANDTPRLLGRWLDPGRFQYRAFRVRVAEGRLVLCFHGPNVGPFYHNTIEWLVNGLVVQRPDQTLHPQAAAWLAETDALEGAALRDWLVVGPFGDDDCTGLARAFPPERDHDPAARFDGKAGPISWQRCRIEPGVAASVPLGRLWSEGGGAAAFALTHVYCRQPTDAVLVAGLSHTGAGYVNGEVVFTDRLAMGLLPAEHRVPVRLGRGWNWIMLKSLCYYTPRSWALRACLLTPDGRPLTGHVVSAAR